VVQKSLSDKEGKNSFCYSREAVCQLHSKSKRRTFKMSLNDINSLSHTKWNCKYHIVFAPKYRRKVFYKEKRIAVGKILRQLCEWKGVKIRELWCKGYYVDTAGKNTSRIAEYIKNQLKEDQLGEQITISEVGPFTGSK
jgi:putative transposase